MIHIATEDTFFIAAPTFESECAICKRTATLELGWVGVRCSACQKVFSSEGGMPEIVTRRRELLKMSRREMAEATGYSPASVKRYEWVRCTRPYAEATERLILSLSL